NYFEGHTAQLKDVLVRETEHLFEECLRAANWKRTEIKFLFTHQVSAGTFKVIAQAAELPPERCVRVFEKYGNTASASIPLALNQALQNGDLQRGDKIAVVGLAAGVSASVQLMIW
ncbi:MAG: 3-oxoacyl-[acyl-carrier-protein] synthase III C-terminal domain-containing protein, partial [Bacteroidota bacterium]